MTTHNLSNHYLIKDIQVINPDHDPRVILDNQRRDQIPEPERCDRCGGTGNEHLFTYRECEDCQGTGKREIAAMPIIDAAQLTRSQRRVMEYLAHGHTARCEYGSVVYVNGGKIATVATMLALERRKLIIRNGDTWKAATITETER